MALLYWTSLHCQFGTVTRWTGLDQLFSNIVVRIFSLIYLIILVLSAIMATAAQEMTAGNFQFAVLNVNI